MLQNSGVLPGWFPAPGVRVIQWTMAAILSMLLAPVAQAAGAGYDEFWPFSQVPRTVSEKAMGPQDGSVLAVVNNRPFSYNSKQYAEGKSPLEDFFDGDILKIAQFRDPASSYHLAELYLQKALEIALHRYPHYPWDVVQCQVNLASLYYQEGRYLDAERLFREAIRFARRENGAEGGLAGIHDYLGQTLRAMSRYAPAEQSYKQALALRLNLYGPNSSRVAGSYMNLAMLYNDWKRPELEKSAMNAAYSVMDHGAFINTMLTPGPYPIPTYMPGKTTLSGELPHMVAFADGIIYKGRPEAKLAVSPSPARRGLSVAAVSKHEPSRQLGSVYPGGRTY